MKNALHMLAALLLATSLGACSSMTMKAGPAAPPGAIGFSEASTDMVRARGMAEAAPVAPADRMLRKSASLTIEVDEEKIESTSGRAESIVADAGGTTESSTLRDDGSTYVSFRVPAERLDETLDTLAGLGEVTSRSAHVVDVTNQAIDLEAKIENLRGLRDRLRLLLDRASKVEDVLKIERELNRVQTQLDSLEGQQKRLLRDVAMSNVSMTIDVREPEMILGPLGYIAGGAYWLVEKLFVIRR